MSPQTRIMAIPRSATYRASPASSASDWEGRHAVQALLARHYTTLHLAKAGGRVVVLEGGMVGSGASGRNGGHLNNGIAHSYLAAKTHLGADRAKALYRAFDDSIDSIERIVREE